MSSEQAISSIMAGIAVDVSGSMKQSIYNNSGGQITRFQGFQESFRQFIEKASTVLSERRSKNSSASIRLFAYGFGFNNESTDVRDLFADLSGLLGKSERNVTLTIGDVERIFNIDGLLECYLMLLEQQIYGNTPMRRALAIMKDRYDNESIRYSQSTAKILFIVSDGMPTDGDPLPEAEIIKSKGVSIISCYITDKDIANPRILFGTKQQEWSEGAQLMYDIASPIEKNSDFAGFLLSRGWGIDTKAKLFIQVNHSSILSEFMQLLISPLEHS